MRASTGGRVLFAGMASAMAAIVIGVPFITGSHPGAALALRSFFSRLCHQDPARSFFLDGFPAAVCVRCLGIYCGVAMGAWLSVISTVSLAVHRAFARQIFLGMLLLNGLDVAAEAFHLHGNLPLPRLLLGASLGLAAGVLLCCSGRNALAESQEWSSKEK